jgi:hypothetical protein
VTSSGTEPAYPVPRYIQSSSIDDTCGRTNGQTLPPCKTSFYIFCANGKMRTKDLHLSAGQKPPLHSHYLAVMPASLALSPFGQTANSPPDLPLCVLLPRDTTVYSSCKGILTSTRYANVRAHGACLYSVISTSGGMASNGMVTGEQ